jgi:hypothetical protein
MDIDEGEIAQSGSSTEEENTDIEDNIPYYTKLENKEQNFRFELAQQSSLFRRIITCKSEKEFNSTIASQTFKGLKVILRAASNVFRGKNLRKISNKKFQRLKKFEDHLVENLNNIKISKMTKEAVKNTLKSISYPILKKMLRLHRQITISGHD